MYFNKIEFEYLAQFEDNFGTAIRSDYTRNVSINRLDEMLKIYKRNVEPNYILCKHCSASILKFIKAIGKCYFADKEEREQKGDNIQEKEIRQPKKNKNGINRKKGQNK